MKDLKDVVEGGLCLGCGLCTINPDKRDTAVKIDYKNNCGHIVPVDFDLLSPNTKAGFEICPGKGYDINSRAKDYELGPYFHLDLGHYDQLAVVSGVGSLYQKNASSSGIMIAIAQYLIERKLVDKAIVTKFTYGDRGVQTKTYASNNLVELLDSQGSKYCPVDLSELIEDLKTNRSNESYVFIGTPCQIAGLRKMQDSVCDLNIKYFIGNFCGGFKSFNNLRRLISMHGIKPQNVDFFRFRGGGQPGSMEIRSEAKKVNVAYPEYVKTTGYSKLKRCHLCVDATAELADFACGDAWLKEYEGKEPTSIVMTRNNHATEILNNMEREKGITVGNISEENVIKSQKGNISTKKYRQRGRMKLYNILGIKTPFLKEGFHINNKINLKLELNVLFGHKVKFIAEKLGVFKLFYYRKGILRKIMFRIFKDNYN
ncbi:Coenzyme F420 hydrogenase/dehydrogenase, beta subunit C-terminal domain [Sphingobacterium corticibacterium]|uniref:Coenzyme F420 hydrogenase n=1 Tax=Sphingobacterium corticibacterium TaxID=2484746 RepID=A0A4Q6XRS8_9SPHI|nr:Coenzyme F420 hydrogenase/dehydrogenase, beta subunit C-terminal domain [Sphingobacterium corticibacterium]RZF58946.1 hypothetical protein EWE74_16640 [Sphingobacterium corticibacterium]